MNSVDTIRWQDLPGNKFIKALDSAMVSDAGYTISQRVRKSNEPRGQVCNVNYDQDYLLEVIARKVIKPLSVLGKDKVFLLFEESWDSYHAGQAGAGVINVE